MATIDRSKPPHAAYIWHSGRDIYVQLPESTYVARFPKTEGGLSRALKLIEPCQTNQPPTVWQPPDPFLTELVQGMRRK